MEDTLCQGYLSSVRIPYTVINRELLLVRNYEQGTQNRNETSFSNARFKFLFSNFDFLGLSFPKDFSACDVFFDDRG